jgi:nitroreductase/NAD-dependent dihydropyrimidine dehydrogenase PreA subunit
MPILGIDYDKCNDCQICFNACSRYFRRDKELNRMIFDDPNNLCDSCGRCITRCKSDAILYENLDEILSYEEVQNPSNLISYESMHKFMIAKRSMRGYKKKKAPKKSLKKILDTMKYAPTGANIRTLECTIISDEDKIKELADVVIDGIIASANPRYYERFKEAKKQGIDTIFYKAPHVLIMHSKNPGDAMNSTIALTYGMLCAQTLGLGSCWIGLAHGVLSANKEAREKIAGIEGFVWGVITLGYPTQIYYKVPPRPDIKTKGLDELE